MERNIVMEEVPIGEREPLEGPEADRSNEQESRQRKEEAYLNSYVDNKLQSELKQADRLSSELSLLQDVLMKQQTRAQKLLRNRQEQLQYNRQLSNHYNFLIDQSQASLEQRSNLLRTIMRLDQQP